MGKEKSKAKKNKRLKNILKSNSITINVFLKRCLGLYNNEEIMRADLTHQDLVKLFPNLKRTSFDTILDDPSMVYTGQVILVSDSSNNVVPYIKNEVFDFLSSDEFNSLINADDWQESSESWSEIKGEEQVQSYELESMSTYELTLLLRLYKRTHQYRHYEIVRRELISREDSIRASNESKFKALKKTKNNKYNF